MSISRKKRAASPAIAAFMSLLFAIGCGSGEQASQSATVDPCAAATPYAKPGPWVAGVTTLDVSGVKVEVWYPADRGTERGKPRDRYDMRDWLPEKERGKVPDADAPLHDTDAFRDLPISAKSTYPVVLFSHGLGGYRLQSSFLMAHLASWGFVVAAPDHVERGLALVLEGDLSKIEDKAPEQLRAALVRLKEESAKPGSRFEGRLDLSHVAAVGHSQGGAAVSSVLGDEGIGAGVWLASGGFGESPAGKDLLMMWGSADRVAKEPTVLQSFEKQPAGARGVGVKEAGHMAFTDLCVIGRDKGGVLQIAQDHGLAVDDLVKMLASDGCGVQPGGAPYLAIEEGWPVIDHYVTAQLRAAFAIDAAPVGLDETAAKCFGDRVSTLKSR